MVWLIHNCCALKEGKKLYKYIEWVKKVDQKSKM